MSIIGHFTNDGQTFVGTISTLTVSAEVRLVPVEKSGDKAPDYRAFVGDYEIGAAWSTTSKAGNPYLSVKLDDPTFAQPIQCRLIKQDDGHQLVWSR